MAFAGMCPIDYGVNVTDCPYGFSLFGLTTVPTSGPLYEDLGLAGTFINVMYSLSPLWAFVFFAVRFVQVWLFSKAQKVSNAELQEELGPHQHVLKYMLFSLLCVLLDFVQKCIFWVRRPITSCLSTCGMPDGQALWSIGLLVTIFIDLMFRWSVPHLTTKTGRDGVAWYDLKEIERLGYYAITTKWFVRYFVSACLCLAPIPMSRITVGDTTYMEMMIGAVEGIALGVSFHVLYVKTLISPTTGKTVHWRLLELMICGSHFWESLTAPAAAEAPADIWQRIVAARDAGLEQSRRRMSVTADSELESPLLGPAEDPCDKKREERAQATHWADLSRYSGLEFAGIEANAVMQEFLQEVKKVEDESVQEQEKVKVYEANKRASLLAEAEAEREELRKQSEEQKAKLLQEAEAAAEEVKRRSEEDQKQLQREANAQRMLLKVQQEAQRNRLLKEAAEEKARLEEQKEKMKKDLERELESQMKSNKDMIEKIKMYGEGLNKLQDAKAAGEMQRLGEALQEKNIKDLLEGKGASGDDQLAFTENLFLPVAKLARDTYAEWRHVRDAFHTQMKLADREIQRDTRKPPHLQSRSVRTLFMTFVDCVEKGLVLRNDPSDKKLCAQTEKMLIEWGENTFPFWGEVHVAIIKKAIWAHRREELGTFDATDLETCLQTVDRKDARKFDVLALKQVEKVNVEGIRDSKKVSDLVGALQQLSTLLFFLEFITKENLDRTYEKFKLNLTEKAMSKQAEAWIAGAEQGYHGKNTLLQEADLDDIQNKEPIRVIESMEGHDLPGLDVFKDIFCMLARVWEQDFGVLVVPHHTQVVALLVFKAFLADDHSTIKTLIGQVSTGEGKSMLIASLALFIVSQTDEKKRKKVHVIGSDERLTLRDFESFKGVFNTWREKRLPGLKTEHFAVGCGSARVRSADVVAQIPDDAWIVYCEAKYVTSYYTQKARTGKLNPELYNQLVLIIDEVDALIVDQSPTDEFVYDISARPVSARKGETSIREYVTELGKALYNGDEGTVDRYMPGDSASEALFQEMTKVVKQVHEFKREPDYTKYSDEQTGTFMRQTKQGMPDPEYKSNFLEVLRLVSQKTYDMQWYERLFVMSKPRVFKLYYRIVGFSGTIGNAKEQEFLSSSYGAQFFLVPPFLQTCKEIDEKTKKEVDLYFVAEWAQEARYQREVSGGPAWVMKDKAAQHDVACRIAWHCRGDVPVLVIAKDPEQAGELVTKLQEIAAKTLGDEKENVIRSLSSLDYQKDPRQYKENLRQSTRFYTQDGTKKTFRVTVTDPSGARGTDYRMDDDEADQLGGLLLVCMHVPESERDWIQYKGRTARQKWRGQYVVVLNEADYAGEVPDGILAEVRADSKPDTAACDALVNSILEYGQRKSEAMMQACHVSYMAGFVANEVCETVWVKFPPKEGAASIDIGLDDPEPRKAFLKVCRMYKYLTFEEVAIEAKTIHEDLRKLGDAIASGGSQVPDRSYVPDALPSPPKAVLFMFDISFSMNGPVGATTRIGACKEQLSKMMGNKKIVGDDDLVGLVLFGFASKYALAERLVKGGGPEVKQMVDDGKLEASMQEYPEPCPEEWVKRYVRKNGERFTLGAQTWMYHTMTRLANDLMDDTYKDYPRWLIALTDGEPTLGDPNSGTPDDAKQVLRETIAKDRLLNLVIITISQDVKEASETEFKALTNIVQKGGAIGKYIAAKNVEDAREIQQAFSDVEQALVDVSGQTEAD